MLLQNIQKKISITFSRGNDDGFPPPSLISICNSTKLLSWILRVNIAKGARILEYLMSRNL